MDIVTAAAGELDELRGKVDRIDEAIVGLLGERLRVVAEIARVKLAATNGALALRPAREASVTRRLLGLAAAGEFPKPALARVWRELFAAATRIQTPFSVCCYVPPHRPELWDMARDHFGSLTPVHRADSPGQALRVAGGTEGGADHVAVLPLPGEDDRWWAALLDAGPSATALRVVARLPFVALPGYPEQAGGLVVAALPPEPTGDDLSLVAIETDGTVSRTRVRDLLAPLGAKPVISHRDPAAGVDRHLIEVEGCLDGGGDPRLDRSLAPLGGQLLRAVVVGCYARPLAAADLA